MTAVPTTPKRTPSSAVDDPDVRKSDTQTTVKLMLSQSLSLLAGY
jgi:hypothetical protein